MYTILSKASINQITAFHSCARIWGQFVNLPQSTSPNGNRSNIKYLQQTHQCASGMCYKRGLLQLVCVQLCVWRERHFEDCMLQPGPICCSDKITAVLRKTTNIFPASEFHKMPRIIYFACAHTTIRYWEIICIYRVFPVQLAPFVNLPHVPIHVSVTANWKLDTITT